MSDTLHNDVITKLRQRYLEDREHVARWTEKMGPQHLAVINLQQEMKEVQNSIVDELQRIAQTYKSDYEIAKAREDSLRASLGKQVREVGTSGQAQVDLKELQSCVSNLPHDLRKFSCRNTPRQCRSSHSPSPTRA